MGKRKSRRKPPPRKRMNKLDTVFTCPFCNYGPSVECWMDKKDKMIGEVTCWICEEKYCTIVNCLTEPIDIYYEWLDQCEKP